MNKTSHDILHRYQRAEAMEHALFVDKMCINAQIYPNWIEGSDHFWYVRTTNTGKQFRVVDAVNGTNQAAFDHQMLGTTLSKASGEEVSTTSLPISGLNIQLEPCVITFAAFGRQWRYRPDDGTCKTVDTQHPEHLLAPDGEKAIFIRAYNLWLRELNTGNERALTSDGELHNAYGFVPERTTLAPNHHGIPLVHVPEAMWSPDSRYVLTVRTDERKVSSIPINWYVPADGTVRPISAPRKYALPGDKDLAEYHIYIVDIETGRSQLVDHPPLLDTVMWASPFSGNRVWWSKDSCRAYFVDMSRHLRTARVVELDRASGTARIVFEEVSDSYIDLHCEFESPAALLPLPETDELIWWSERIGWAHLYLYELKSGNCKHAITTGDWLVREVLYFDVERREIFIQAAGRVTGRDPYYREICRVNVDTKALTVLASSDHDYISYKPGTMAVYAAAPFGKATVASSGFAPSGNYFVATRTRVDEAPVVELRDRDGLLIMEVEKSDISNLPHGWQWPEPVQLQAADGETTICGIIFRPSDFDATKRYPVIDIAFTNPFYAAVPKGAFGNDTLLGYYYMSSVAWAELGFIVVLIDGRGGCYRNKAFHDHSYGVVHKGSDLEDHVTGIKQLAQRYPYIDLERVGIVDNGGSYGPVLGMLQYPEFYKVGAVASIWDPRLVMQGDIYQGPNADYKRSAAGHLVENLQGNLLLIQGMLDDFFQPAGMFQLVDALVKANKDFDMLILPTGGHAWNTNHYGTRRMWDYMVKHLLGIEPPAQFKLSNGSEYAIEKMYQPD